MFAQRVEKNIGTGVKLPADRVHSDRFCLIWTFSDQVWEICGEEENNQVTRWGYYTKSDCERDKVDKKHGSPVEESGI